MSTAFLAVAILGALTGLALAGVMTHELRKRGIKVNFPLIRLYFFRYLEEYRQVTLKETGQVGIPYHAYIAAMLVALVCAVIGLVLRAM